MSTIRTGGLAEYFVICNNEQDIIAALLHGKSSQLPVTVLGGGSNSLISDQGVKGLVIKMASTELRFNSQGHAAAAAGVPWDQFVEEACRRGLTGLEALSGIPGFVGACPIQNIGAYGQEVATSIQSVRAIHKESLETRVFSNEDCKFAYRSSFFKTYPNNPWIITEVQFQLDPTAETKPSYLDLQDSLSADTRWSCSQRLEKILLVREHVLRIRAKKGMVLNPADPDSISLGSFFINPVVDDNTKSNVEAKANALGAKSRPPLFQAGDRRWKISAAWLIENSGIRKGFSLGRAKVSSKHVLAITNPGGASTTDILHLQKYIENQVKNVFQIKLEREPVFLE
jgi:UDP-N-acetylmuramate dehydrogenase